MYLILGQLARKLRVYGAARALKVRLDKLSPAKAKHRRQMAEFYSLFVRPGSIVFDVGANNGNRSEIFLKLGARVIGVEPQPLCQDVLSRLFGRNSKFTLVPKALGTAPGEAEMFLGDLSVLSTLSRDWIEKAATTGRYGDHRWSSTIKVPITTMDALIAEHGMPSFCKIDVEGFEVQVLKGLSKAIKAVSFELISETADNALACIDHLQKLGIYEFNLSRFESMQLDLPAWVSAAAIKEKIDAERNGPNLSGDIYARLK
jgi:FkbM family methyltransferase